LEPRSVVFVDSRIDQLDQVLNGLHSAQVVVLDATRDGITQITETLNSHSQIESVHIISHGSAGRLQLGSSWFDAQTLNTYANQIRSWQSALTIGADILLYGCEVGAGMAGQSFLQQFSQLSGADIAASVDWTGNASLGGDWDLEAHTGAIQTASLVLEHYQGILPIYNGKNYVLTSTAQTWEAAQAEAQSQGGNLVTINDAAEETWLRQTFGTTEGLWIGITDRTVEGQFRWVNGEAVTYTNWAPGEPNNGGGTQDYGWMNYTSTGQWDDHFPTATLRGIIEIPSTPTSFVYNGKQYRLTNTAKTWEEAQTEAQSQGGNLVTINDAAEEAWLRQTFGTTEGLWIGITDRTVEGQFRWVNGETVTYTNWAPGEPNNGGGTQDYGWMNYTSTGQWDDHFPTATLRGIIEIPTVTTSAIALEQSTYSVNEAAGSLVIGVVRSGSTTGTASIQYQTSPGSATAGSDFTTTNGTLTFAAGETRKTFTIPILNDTLQEGNETFSIGIQSPTGATLGTVTTSTVTIVDDESSTSNTYNGKRYVLTTSAKTWEAAQTEAQSLGGNLVTINDAAEETWLRQTFGVTEGFWIGLSDRTVEGQFQWINGEPVTYTNWAPGEPNNSGGNQDYAWLNFTSTGQWDDHFPDATLRGIIEIESSQVALKDSNTVFVNEVAGVATVIAVRTGDLSQSLTVEYTTNELGTTDSAQAGLDYTTPTFNGRPNTGQIVFGVGESEKAFTIPILNDALVEANETFAVGLQNPSAGTLGAPRTKLITIIDDENPNTIAVSSVALNVAENVGNAVVTITRSGNVSGSATVNYSTSNGTAISPGDYTATSGTLTFAAGQTSRTLSIPIQNDTNVENTENFVLRLSNPTGGTLGTNTTTTITILDDDLSLGNLTRNTVVSGLNQPTAFDWTPDGRYMMVAQKNGVVRLVDNGTLRTTPVIDLSAQVNNTRDRGLLGIAVHPNFSSNPYIYLSYTYDPPETVGRTGLAGPDGNGNRPSRLVRLTVNPTTMIADPNSLVVLVGKNSNWAYTSRPDGNSTGDTSIVPSGIVNGTTITAPANQVDVGTQDNDPGRAGIQNQNIRDYLATDSESHTIGAVHFGPDGLLYLANGDGTSYNFADPRTVRVQDINNLSGKILRIDPITGQGVASNPFYNGDPDSNQSKVFYSGLRNPFRFGFDPVTSLPVIGDVGWNSWEEINTGVPGSNFGWPYLEGPNRTGGYSSLAQAISFYNNGNRNNPTDAAAVFPLLSRSHGAPDNANAIIVGDFYNASTLIFGDVNGGTFYAATLNASRQISNVQVFDSGIPFYVDMEMGPDGRLYAVNLGGGSIVRWNPA
jgi:glucose/arabinose dehydrogenase